MAIPFRESLLNDEKSQMSYSFQNPGAEVIESYLKSAKTIAIVGLSHRKEAASYQVAHFLQAAGYRIIPVNPKLEGQELLV